MSKESDSSASPPPPVAILQMLAGKWVSQAISAVCRFNIADHLEKGPKTPEQLAELSKTHAGALYRTLRALASVGVFAEDERGRFANTPLSDALRAESPGSMRSMAIFFGNHPTWDAWGEFDHSLVTGRSSFEHVHDCGYFDFIKKHPEEGRYFDEAMTGFSLQEVEAIHRAFDFSDVGTLVDVAGGHGALLVSTLQKNPQQRGILFDQPEVVKSAKPFIAAAELSGRCELIAGDFFKEIPSGADGYLMKHIIHDWNDNEALEILKNIHRAAKAKSKLFIIDAVIESGNAPTFAKLLDIECLVLYRGGRERTRVEFNKLLDATGFEIQRIVPTESMASVIEAVRR